MPSFTNTWDETAPAGSRALSLGDDDIRQLKLDLRERLAIDHKLVQNEAGVITIGYHLPLHLIDNTSNPAAVAGTGVLFSKTIAGQIELFYLDANSNVTQLTSGGVLLDTVLARPGNWMLSSVTAVRTGWTNVSATYSNKFMRINATPLTTGGVDTHTHTEAAHTHGSGSLTTDSQTGTGAAGSGVSGGTHSHSVTGGSTASTSPGATAASDNIPAYVQVVVFQKN